MKLKELRQKYNLTQKDMAKIINKTPTGYGYYETERSEPDIKTLIKLADYFHITLDELVGREQSNIIDKGLLNDVEIDIIDKLLQLDRDNQLRLQAYTYSLWQNQHNEQQIIKKVKGE